VGSRGVTALHLAAAFGHDDVIQALIMSPGVDVNSVTSQGLTALHVACRRGHAGERVRSLGGVEDQSEVQ
jgi:ankyrin repeat protein